MSPKQGDRLSGKESVGEVPPAVRAFSERLIPLVTSYAGQIDSVTMARVVATVLNEHLAERRDPEASLARALNRGSVRREELKQEEGGSLSAEQAARQLGLSKTAVIDRYRKGRLLGWRENRQHAIRYPAWQFSGEGSETLPGLETVLAVLNRPGILDDWGRIGFFLGGRRSRDGERPLDLLRRGRVEEVKAMAAAHVE